MASLKDENLKEKIALHDQNEAKVLRRLLPNFVSVFPDALMIYIMRRCGISNPNEVCARALGIAVQKYAADIINDAFVMTELKEVSRDCSIERPPLVLTENILKEVLVERGIKL